VIIFKTISLKNFLSYGNVPTVWNLNKSPTTLVVGKNGSGKSGSLTDSICFALFGKPYRTINKPQLVNSINGKNCVVELEMSVNGTPYKIIRGIKPNIFEIYCDGKKLDQDAAMKDMQEYLETNIIKLNFRTFCQVVILGSAGFTPFMKLTSAARREVIEDVLDIGIFSKMNTLLKERISSTKEELKLISIQLDSVKSETESQKKIIQLIKNTHTSRLNELSTEIEQLQNQILVHKKQIDAISNKIPEEYKLKYTQNSKELNSIQDEISDLNFEINQSVNTISKIESMNKCPSCLQGISYEHKNHVKETFGKTVSDLKTKIESMRKHEQDLLNFILEYENIQNEYNSIISENKQLASIILKQIQEKQNTIEKIKSDTGDIDKELIILKEIANKGIRLIQREKELKLEKNLQDISQILLKDSGIKTAIIKEYLPALNSLINKYLSAFDFFVNFNLDENFNEVIKSRGRDEFSYASFSEGEKKRLDLAILLAFRQIAAMKNSAKINLLIMDEAVDSSLDLDARAKFTELLDTMKDSNVFVISHTDTSPDAYSSLIRVEKVGDFSTFSYM
jgi:DNA repair exonuclease SbcCD ATPase subunit